MTQSEIAAQTLRLFVDLKIANDLYFSRSDLDAQTLSVKYYAQNWRN